MDNFKGLLQSWANNHKALRQFYNQEALRTPYKLLFRIKSSNFDHIITSIGILSIYNKFQELLHVACR